MAEVIHLAQITNDPDLIDVRQALLHTVEQLDSGEITADKVMILLLDTESVKDAYDVQARMVRLSTLEGVALVEAVKHWFLAEWLTGEKIP